MDGVGESLGLAKLEQLLERAENRATQQRMGTAAERSAVKETQAGRRVLQPQILGYLSVVGAVAASKDAELAEQFRMPPANATHQALLTMTRAILERATAQKELLVSLGMSEHVLDELATALGQYEQTVEATSAGRREHLGARDDPETVGSHVSETIRLLDKGVRDRFGDNAELMARSEERRVGKESEARVQRAVT